MFARTSRTLVASAALLALVIGLAPIVEPAARAVDPTPAVETPTPDPGATPSPPADATPTPDPTPTPPRITPTFTRPYADPDLPYPGADAHARDRQPTPDEPAPLGDVYRPPYWEMSSAILDYLDYDALSVISLFSVTWTGAGTLDRGGPGYAAMTGSIGRSVIAAAKARGVRVEICFTTFGVTKNATLFGDSARRKAITSWWTSSPAGVDDVNVDAELIEGIWFDEYGLFLRDLRAALRADDPTATVSVATNANVSGARMARRAADAGTDRIFIMGYAYRSAGSNPGSIAPLVGRSSPGGLDIRWTIDRYAAEGVPLGRVLLGLPYYGMTWPTSSSALGAARTGAGTTYTPRKQMGKPASLGVSLRYEPGESASWYAWYDKAAATWRQVFYDTPTSLRPKYAYAISRGLVG
jgi:spore germination protein YaaH